MTPSKGRRGVLGVDYGLVLVCVVSLQRVGFRADKVPAQSAGAVSVSKVGIGHTSAQSHIHGQTAKVGRPICITVYHIKDTDDH